MKTPVEIKGFKCYVPEVSFNLDDVIAEFKIPKWLNNLFYRLMLIDAKLIKYRLSLPFGNSIILLAQKNEI
jgi:hypothetical protein